MGGWCHIFILTEFVETMTQNQKNQVGKLEAIAPFPHPDLTSFVYLQILEISNSGDSGTDNFLKTQTTSYQIYWVSNYVKNTVPGLFLGIFPVHLGSGKPLTTNIKTFDWQPAA